MRRDCVTGQHEASEILADLFCKDSDRALSTFWSHVLRRWATSPNTSIWQEVIYRIGRTTKRVKYG